MKHLKLAGLCLASMLAIVMAPAGNASAVPAWLACTSGEGTTEYSTDQCTTASKGGEFVSVDARAAAIVGLAFTLTLKDTGTALGTAEVQCWGGRSTEIVASGNEAEILTANVEKPETLCKGLKVCESAKVKTVEGVNLPWRIELEESTEKNMTKTTVEGTGGGAGWKLACDAPIVGEETDECTDKSGEPEEVSFLNTTSSGVSLVLGRFLEARKASCTLGSSTSGSFSGLLALLQEDGGGFSIANETTFEIPRWYIEAKELAEKETFTAKSVSGKALKLKNPKIEVECGAATMGSGNIKNPYASLRLEKVRLEKCTVLKPAAAGEEKCIVETGEISLNPQLAVNNWQAKTGEEALIDFYHSFGKEIAKFTLNPETGKNCTTKGTYIVTGEALAELENSGTEETTKKFLLKCPDIKEFWLGSAPLRTMGRLETSLKIGLAGALEAGEFCGEFEFTLTSGKTFRTKPGNL